MAALAARCHLIRMGLVSLDQSWNFYHNQLPGFSVTITTEFSFFGLNEITRYWFMWAEPLFRLHCKKKLGSFPHFSFFSFHFHSCLSLHLHCTCEPVFRTFHGMTLIITELNTFSTENWQCFLYDEPFCLHFIKNDKWNKRLAFWDSCSHW